MSKTKEEIAKQKHEYYLKIKASGKTKIYQKTNRVRHREKRNAYMIKWHKDNSEHNKKYFKFYEQTDAGIARRRKYYNLNKDLLRERNKEYYKKPPAFCYI